MKILMPYLLLGATLATYAFDDCFVPTPLDTRWKRRCKRRQFISTIDSTFKRNYGDRTFKVCCRTLPLPEELLRLPVRCNSWTGFVNTFGGVLDFVCPNSGFIAGIRSMHNNEREDRVFRFKCCSVPGTLMEDCKTNGIVNGFNQRAAYTVEEGRVLNGMAGIFRDHYKDRLYEFQDCLMRKIQ